MFFFVFFFFFFSFSFFLSVAQNLIFWASISLRCLSTFPIKNSIFGPVTGGDPFEASCPWFPPFFLLFLFFSFFLFFLKKMFSLFVFLAFVSGLQHKMFPLQSVLHGDVVS